MDFVEGWIFWDGLLLDVFKDECVVIYDVFNVMFV